MNKLNYNTIYKVGILLIYQVYSLLVLDRVKTEIFNLLTLNGRKLIDVLKLKF